MRKTPLVLLSTSVALIGALLSIEMRTSLVSAKPETPAIEKDSSVSFDPTPQNPHFIWVSAEGDQGRSGYHRVIGGKHRDGTEMYICRVSGFVPGKIYRNSCHYSAAGQENVITINYEVLLTDTNYEGGALDDGTKLMVCRAGYTPGKVYKDLCLYPYGGAEDTYRLGYYEVLLTNAQYQWKKMDDVTRADIKTGAVKGGSDRDGADTLYICRKKMSDGTHPGKYSWKNRLCYIPWGGKEYFYRTSFEILFR